MPRQLPGNIVHAFTQYTEGTEIPKIFSLWCGISAVSAMLGRRCYIDMGHYQIHPNLYLMLIAESGVCRKSAAIKVVEDIMPKVKPPVKIFSQKSTVEALISNLCSVSSDGAVVKETAEGLIIADEVSTLVNKTSAQNGMVAFLTTLWDAKDAFSYETKGRGKETIYNSCVSMLTGSTVDWLRAAITEDSVAGGFTSRVIFVYCSQPEKLMLFTEQRDEIKKIKASIINDLGELVRIRGPFTFTPQARDFFEEEYKNFMSTSPFVKNKYLSGYASRRATNLFKLSMTLSAGRSDERVIDLKDGVAALKILKFTEEHLPRVMNAIATSSFGVHNVDLMEVITKYGKMSRRELITVVHNRMRIDEIDSALSTLEQAGLITQYVGGKDITIEVRNKDKCVPKSFTEQVLKGMISE